DLIAGDPSPGRPDASDPSGCPGRRRPGPTGRDMAASSLRRLPCGSDGGQGGGTVTVMTPDQLTKPVLAAYPGTPDPRLRQLLTSLIGHLHAFAVETRLTRQEWQAGVDFLTATGQKCDDERQEFILLSDVLGFSSLVDLINAADGATESTVLGPFYVPGAPVRAMGEQLGRPEDGRPTLVRGRVTDPAGEPLDGPSLDVRQTAGNGLSDTPDPEQPPCKLRGGFVAGPHAAYPC